MDRKPLKHKALIMDKLYIDKGSSCGRVFHKLLAIFVAGVYLDSIFAGATCRTGPDSMLILCFSVSL